MKILPTATQLIFMLLFTACANGPYVQTGTVLDAATGAPIEGAFVLATYDKCGGVMGGHSSCWCESTQGMYTGVDGKFKFPVLDEVGRMLSFPTAIKADYQYVKVDILNYADQSQNKKKFWASQNVLLSPQDAVTPNLNFQSHSAACHRAPSRQNAAAGTEFLRLELAEAEKYAPGQSTINSLWSSIETLDQLPDVPGSFSVPSTAHTEKNREAGDAEFAKRRRDISELNANARRAVSLGVIVTVGYATGKPIECVSIGDRGLTAILSERVAAAGLKTFPNKPQEGLPCVAPEDRAEAMQLAQAVGREYLAKFGTRVERYPRASELDAAARTRSDFSSAVVRNDILEVERFLKAGVDPNTRLDTDVEDYFNLAAIVVATAQGYADIVELLAAKSANPEAVNGLRETPLLILANRGTQFDRASRRKIARVLLDSKANPNVTTGSHETPLSLACGAGIADITQLLIAAGANVNQSDGAVRSPLDIALARLNDEREPNRRGLFKEIAVQLVDAGAVVDDKPGRPLYQLQDREFKQALGRRAAERSGSKSAPRP